MKLRKALLTHGNAAYRPTNNGIKGRVTYGEFVSMNNSDRELYSLESTFFSAPSGGNALDMSREEFLSQVECAHNQHTVSMHNFGLKKDAVVNKYGNLTLVKSLDVDDTLKEVKVSNALNLYNDMNDERKYEKFIDRMKSPPKFNEDLFIKSLNFSEGSQNFMSGVLSTPMFERFIEGCVFQPSHHEVRLLNESILSKKKNPLPERLNMGGRNNKRHFYLIFQKK